MPSYDIITRAIPRRTIVSISRHLHAAETGAFFADAFARLRSAVPAWTASPGCLPSSRRGSTDGPLELSARWLTARMGGGRRRRPAARRSPACIRVLGWLACALAVVPDRVRGQTSETCRRPS